MLANSRHFPEDLAVTVMVVGHEATDSPMSGGDPLAAIVEFPAVGRLPIEVRRRLARRRRRALRLRDLLAMIGVSGAAALLLTITLFSLIIGR